MLKLNFTQSFFKLAGTFSLIAIGNNLIINSADAFSINTNAGIANGGFEQTIDGENPTNGWSTTGDVTTIIENVVQASGGDTGFVNPVSGDRQAILTTAYDIPNGMNRVDDVRNTNGLEGPAQSLNFNQSGTNPVDADTLDPTTEDLQSFLGLETNSLSIDRNPQATNNPRTSKEGSGISQTFEIEITADDVTNGTNAFEISFNWAYLTNDGFDNGSDGTFPGGNQDYSFFTLYEENDNVANRQIELLGDSSGAIGDPLADNNYNSGNTEFYNTNSVYTQTITGLPVGTYNYTIGFGVVDVDGSGRSSALVLDNFGVRQVPFEFSPSAGIGIVFGFLGLNRLRRRFKK